MEFEKPSIRTASLSAAIVFAAACILLLNPVKHANDAYPHNYHGSLTSWFALMSENMEQTGFGSSRCLSPINPNPSGPRDLRLYVTHPSLDVVTRAGLIRLLGNSEWVIRLQGLIGCFGAAILLFAALRGLLSTPARVVAALTMAGMPIFQRLTSLSMHHPMTLLFSMGALCLYLRGRGTKMTPLRTGLFALLLLCAMHNDWPGYFMVGVIWMLELARLRNADRRLLIGLPVLTLVSIALLLLHVNVIGGQDFFSALRASAESPLPPLTSGSSFSHSWNHQVMAFGWSGIAMMLLALLGSIALPNLRPLRSLLLGLLLLGALNFILFPMKAPREDFWGCYWLPLVGLSAGVLAQALMSRMRVPGLAVVLLAAVLTSASAMNVNWDQTAQESGVTHKKQAEWILNVIHPKDRGLLLTNAPNRELKIMMAYTRVSMLFDDITPDNIDSLPARVRPLFHELPAGRVLFICDPEEPAAIELLLRHGSLYREDIPFIIDVTAFISSE